MINFFANNYFVLHNLYFNLSFPEKAFESTIIKLAIEQIAKAELLLSISQNTNKIRSQCADKVFNFLNKCLFFLITKRGFSEIAKKISSRKLINFDPEIFILVYTITQ